MAKQVHLRADHAACETSSVNVAENALSIQTADLSSVIPFLNCQTEGTDLRNEGFRFIDLFAGIGECVLPMKTLLEGGGA